MASFVTINAGSDFGTVTVKESPVRIHERLQGAGANESPSILLTAEPQNKLLVIGIRAFVSAAEVI